MFRTIASIFLNKMKVGKIYHKTTLTAVYSFINVQNYK